MNFKPLKAFINIALAAGMISACQQTTTSTTTPEPTQAGGKPAPEVARTMPPVKTATSPVAPTPDHALDVDFAALRGEEITFWHPWQGELARQVQLAADEFNRSNEWGLKVHASSYYNAGALNDAVNETRGMLRPTEVQPAAKTPTPAGPARPAGSAGPHLVAAATDQLAAWALAESPVTVDLMPYINDPQAGLSETEASAYLPVFWQQDRDGEVQFGLPALRSAQVLFYNQSWAKDLGFNRAPLTPNEFKQQACAAAVANNTAKVIDLYGTGGWMVDADPLTTLSWLAVFGADPLPDAEGQPYRFDGKESNEALTFLRGMIDDGCAWISKADVPYETFAKRKALFYSGTLTDLPMQIRWQEQLQSQDTWMVTPFPGKDGKPVVFSSGYSYGVMQSTPEAQLGAWLFARWLSRPEIAKTLAELLPSLPVTTTIREQLSGTRGSIPWDQVLPLTDSLRAAPGFASWRQARRPLQDAAWQIYHLPPDGLEQILPQLDITVEEILKED